MTGIKSESGWKRSGYCADSACVEVNSDDSHFVRVRDPKEKPASGEVTAGLTASELWFTRSEWKDLLGAAALAASTNAAGPVEFSIPVQSAERLGEPVAAGVSYLGQIGMYAFTDGRQESVLLYTEDEMTAFVRGAASGDFDVSAG